MDKADIISEIKRTADDNGGVPLGRQRFATDTGIKQSDWWGVHWATWSEALAEAGFQPNEFIEGYDEEWLIESFIRIIREVGQWPSEGKLRLICKDRDDLPNGKTFRVRLGKKAECAAIILGYCQEHARHDDIINICEPIVESAETTDGDTIEPDVFGFVYLMKFGKYHKIGRSNSVGRREYEIGTKLPEELVTVHAIKTDDPVGVERLLAQSICGQEARR